MVVLFVAINLFVMLVNYGVRLVSEPVNPVTKKYGAEKLLEVYEGMDYEEINTLLKECWERPYRYREYTNYAEAPIEGKFVNVSEDGVRRSRNQGPWPPNQADFNIFVFGGSTTFGYGVSDDETLPSCIQGYLSDEIKTTNIRVYNLGCGYYLSSRERILFFDLLQKDIIPDVAVFIDGLNDFCFTGIDDEIAEHVNDSFSKRTKVDVSDLIKLLPVHTAARSVEYFIKSFRTKKHKVTPIEIIDSDLDSSRFSDTDFFDFVIHRYLRNIKFIRLVAAEYGVIPIFVWQPHPGYKYDLKNNPFLRRKFEAHGYGRQGYGYFAKLLEENPLGNDFIWCADIQEGRAGPNYIDKVHYSPAFSDYFAKTLVSSIFTRNLISPSSVNDAIAGRKNTQN